MLTQAFLVIAFILPGQADASAAGQADAPLDRGNAAKAPASPRATEEAPPQPQAMGPATNGVGAADTSRAASQESATSTSRPTGGSGATGDLSATGDSGATGGLSASASPSGTATWLVNLARHQGHLVGRSDPHSASLHVLALLEAATDVSPDCSEAYYWLYDLYHRMGQTDAARAALSEYVRLTPGDDAARIRLLEIELADRQTAEARAEYVKSNLKCSPLSRTYESELHRWLANYYFERRENDFAAQEVEHALRLNPMNVAARQLAYEMFGETEPALQRVEMALQLIAMNPTQANLVWDLAEFLDRLSLHTYAQEWYNRAIDIHRRAGAGTIPPEFWHKLAMSYMCSGDFERAKATADEAVNVASSFYAARLLRANAEKELGLTEAAEADLRFVSKAYEARIDEVVADHLTDEAADLAWFFCYHQPDKDRALTLSKIAMEDANPSELACLAHGYALHLNGQTDEAIAVLDPLSSVDQLAALELAKAQIERGNKAQAITILHKAATIQYSGIAYGLIRGLLAKHGETAPQAPLHTKVIAALDRFERDVFDFHKRPGDFLKFSLRFADAPTAQTGSSLPSAIPEPQSTSPNSQSTTMPPVGPLDVVFRLENVGPFVITLGEGFMSRPLIAVSARVGGDGDGGVAFDGYLQVLMNSHPVLPPGDAVEKTIAIDVGPIREHLIRTITQSLSIEVTATFDPVYIDGELTAGMGSITAGPIKIERRGIATTAEAITTLLSQANSTDAGERATVAELLGALRADAEYNPSGSDVENLPIDAINTALATLLSDHDWHVRARAMVAVGWSELDPRITNAAASGVRADAPPVVKMLAIRLFAQKHGEKFVQVLKQLSKTDPNQCVRTMAESYLPRPPHVAANSTIGSSEELEP
ncbi:MAG: tetratricopeptide repeat protein [Phycisphaerae bacterium]|nr:tetratricopeptide repeat protein [Phycisphaerae bacterium]